VWKETKKHAHGSSGVGCGGAAATALQVGVASSPRYYLACMSNDSYGAQAEQKCRTILHTFPATTMHLQHCHAWPESEGREAACLAAAKRKAHLLSTQMGIILHACTHTWTRMRLQRSKLHVHAFRHAHTRCCYLQVPPPLAGPAQPRSRGTSYAGGIGTRHCASHRCGPEIPTNVTVTVHVMSVICMSRLLPACQVCYLRGTSYLHVVCMLSACYLHMSHRCGPEIIACNWLLK